MSASYVTYPEDRVLIGVINRKSDLEIALRERWYRIPRERAPRIIETEFVAFYLSRGMGQRNGGIYHYARRTGHELVRRRDLRPDESDHARADDLYFKITFQEVQEKNPPILNPTNRPITFILTTWDRFSQAVTIADLYSKNGWYVERLVALLRKEGIAPEDGWQDHEQEIAELRIRCQRGMVQATTGIADTNTVQLIPGESEARLQADAAALQAAIRSLGGPLFINLPPEG